LLLSRTDRQAQPAQRKRKTPPITLGFFDKPQLRGFPLDVPNPFFSYHVEPALVHYRFPFSSTTTHKTSSGLFCEM
jgi:hypothetical protein